MVGCEPSTEGSEFGAANSGVTCTTSELVVDWVGGQHATGAATFVRHEPTTSQHRHALDLIATHEIDSP